MDERERLRLTVLPQLHGVLVLDKPSGPTSTRCLAQIKRLGQKKIGHAGTLDPLASGVLLVLLGQATKLSPYLLEGGGKVYSGTLRLGQTSDTWDSEGEILAEAPWDAVSPEAVTAGIEAWRGVKEQAVPPYSAAKLSGQPLYRLARKGRAVTGKVKRVEISQATVLEVSLPLVRFRVACGSGTYIRSLAHSLGKRLGCGAVLTQLTREYSHPFGIEHACGLQAVLDDPGLLVRSLRPLREALPGWPCIALSRAEAADIRNGRTVPADPAVDLAALAESGNRAVLLENDCELALARLEPAACGYEWAVLRGLWN